MEIPSALLYLLSLLFSSLAACCLPCQNLTPINLKSHLCPNEKEQLLFFFSPNYKLEGTESSSTRASRPLAGSGRSHTPFSLFFPKERSETIPELCEIEQAWAGGHNKEVHKLEVQ
jgi:hypothetical protein